MKRFFFHGPKRYWVVTFLVPILVFILACGPGEEATPTPTKAATTVAGPTPTAVATPTPTPAGGIPQRGGTISQTGGYPTTFDMIRNTSHTTGTVTLGKLFLTAMYDPGPTGAKQFVCDYCDKWSLEDGGKTIVFQLSGAATFHDGKPITSKDIKYSLERVMGRIDNVTALRAGWLKDYVTSIDTPDDRTMKINMPRPAPVVPSLLTITMVAIEPEGTKPDDLAAPPIGPGNKYTSGPFYLKEAVKDSHLLYERYPNYFKKGLPYLDSIKIQAFPDLAAAATAVLTGTVDYWFNEATPPSQFFPNLFQKKEQGKLNLIRLPGGLTLGGVIPRYTNPLFNDMRVRQAINLGVDREEWGNGNYYQGLFAAATIFPVGTPWSRTEEQIWNVLPGWGTGAKKQQEIQQAKDLLKAAGYAPGSPNLPFMTTASASFNVEGIQRQMKNIGFNATLEVVETTVNSQRQGSGNFVILVFPFGHAVMDPDDAIGNYFKTGAARNWRGISDPFVDQQWLLMSSEQDPAKRKALFFGIENYLLDNLLDITWPGGYQDEWFNSKLRGLEPAASTNYKSSTHRGEEWWLAK